MKSFEKKDSLIKSRETALKKNLRKRLKMTIKLLNNILKKMNLLITK